MLIDQRLVMTVIGYGFGTTIVSLILKQRFVRKHEMQKDQSAREFRNHQRRVDVLDKLLPKLFEVQRLFQQMTGCIGGTDAAREKYRLLFIKLASEAEEQLVNVRLWISPDIIGLCEKFFNRAGVGYSKFDCTIHILLGTEGELRKECWDSAMKIAFEELPKLLQDIESSARKTVHGGSDQDPPNPRSRVLPRIPAIVSDALNRGRGTLLHLWRYTWQGQVWRGEFHQ
jgi:hypothetical protein